MNVFSCSVEVRWADLDPNFHMRHSVYYDLGAYCRIEYLKKHGITAQFMHQHQFGPILFREECVFKKEILLGDAITIDLRIIKSTRDYSRWTMQHYIYKNGDTLAAILTMDGAWIDMAKRKLTAPPSLVIETFEQAPKDDSYIWIEKTAKQ